MKHEELLEAIGQLWADELAEIARIEDEGETKAAEVERKAAELAGRIMAAENEVAALRSERDSLPSRLSVADLEGDDAQAGEVRRRWAEIAGETEGLTTRIEAARDELQQLPDPDAVRDEAATEAEQRRLDLSGRALRESDLIGETLTRRAQAVGVYREWTGIYQPAGY